MMNPKIQKILYVDDDQVMQMLVKLTLEMDGKAEVITCPDGIEFLLDTFHERPDVIILDVMMELMSGPEIMREIKLNESLQNIPVIFLTSRAELEDVKKYMELGAAGVIAKPFDVSTLADQVHELWCRYHGHA